VDLATAEEVAADLDLGSDRGAALARLVDASMIDAIFESAPDPVRRDRIDHSTRYRMLETLRAFGHDRLVANGEDDAATRRLLRWAAALVERVDAAQETDDEPAADVTVRRELATLRATWRLARERGDIDTAAALAVGLYQVSAWRDLTEPGAWAEELAADPALAGHPQAAAVLGSAANAAYHRGDYAEADRLARAGLSRPPSGQGLCLCRTGLACAALAAGAFGDVVAHGVAAAQVWTRPSANLGIAALGALYGGDLARARELQERAAVAAGCPTNRGFAAYVAGEIANLGGDPDSAEAHYTAALDEFRMSGTTFGTAITLVGLLSARTRAGRTHDALRGFRDLLDYFVRAGNWTHQWTALRNLAALLRALDDPAPATLIDEAADAAPDAPPPPDGRRPGPAAHAPGRAEALATARAAIARHLGTQGAG
jgi:tetratricopeptide (TPR) repeat protein